MKWSVVLDQAYMKELTKNRVIELLTGKNDKKSKLSYLERKKYGNKSEFLVKFYENPWYFNYNNLWNKYYSFRYLKQS